MSSILFILLYPFSILYNAVTAIRNLLFFIGVLPSKSFDVPIVSVGNLAVGGTGKTPMIEYLITVFSAKYKLAVLSRGYKRKTKGFLLVKQNSTVAEVGDEPLQMKAKFPDAVFAVCEKRVIGVEQLLNQIPQLQLVLLDDAFQHRHILPRVQILLTDYSKLYIQDYLLPAGRLRENRRGAKRATIIIVTKCPPDLSKTKALELEKMLRPTFQQKVFFTTMKYGSVYDSKSGNVILAPNIPQQIIACTAIANPKPFYDQLQSLGFTFIPMQYPDHHFFTSKDEDAIMKRAKSKGVKTIITTEKDLVKLSATSLVAFNIWVLPLSVAFLFNQDEAFLNLLEKNIS
ncbi:MAG: tetraacyldisaccharide 4'-kinase [Bacteroidales bacterium]|nr:tetraacyldisaccharide 4'-kinase [Bacteroidales bacterium]